MSPSKRLRRLLRRGGLRRCEISCSSRAWPGQSRVRLFSSPFPYPAKKLPLRLVRRAEFSGTALKSLSTNPFDIPFCMLYTVDEVSPKMTKKEVRLGFDRSSRTTIKLTCRGSTGVPENHPFLIKEALVDVTPAMSRCSSASTSTGTGSTTTALDFRDRLDSGSLSPGAAMNSPAPSTSSTTSTSRFGVRTSDKSPAWTWPFEEACLKRDPVVVEDLGSLAESLDRSKGWAVPTRQAVVIPVLVEAGQTVPSAVLVIGVNALNRYGASSLPPASSTDDTRLHRSIDGNLLQPRRSFHRYRLLLRPRTSPPPPFTEPHLTSHLPRRPPRRTALVPTSSSSWTRRRATSSRFVSFTRTFPRRF